MKIKALKSLFISFAVVAGLSSCEYIRPYEDPLSLSDEEFAATVQGRWNVIKAGTSFGWDEHEENHIYDDIALENKIVDYVIITDKTVTMHFLSPMRVQASTLGLNGEPHGTVWEDPVSEFTWDLDIHGQECESNYYFEQDHESEGIYLSYFTDLDDYIESMPIHVFGKKDGVADRLIFGRPILFEMVRD